ncbi:pilus assembly protein PilP [Thalassotalea sp. HSM 43]|uniref:pilus assembly protein PilP n=1 Tax=Thalassotalea sp. HSM 43 TaxID=2552945 RepID=UPI0010804602|nr:pilus assembly protein PilP [Thalassotalea sp. HSM 43]QBY04678.1 pilus assembly protein PilP [Thalassotalea sp. HSM 43]
MRLSKPLLGILPIFLLTACFDDKTDLHAHIEKVKASTPNRIEPMPAVTEFNHFDYSAFALRSPFVAPKPEAMTEKLQQMSDCLHPDPRRRKQPLEKFALESMSMRGTLGEEGIIWALIQAGDTTLHRVSIGSYMGLYNGRITSVGDEEIIIVELIPDGAGCWVERETTVAMVDSDLEGQRN